MRQAILLLIACLVFETGYGQRSYNYSRRYSSTARHASNKAAMKKALSKKRQPAVKNKSAQKPVSKVDTTKRKP